MKKALFMLAACVMGVLAGFMLLELTFIVFFGNPAKKFLHSLEYYRNYEFYNPHFKKTINKKGRMLYTTRRKRAAAEAFPIKKARNTKRVFIVGESIAQAFGYSKGTFRDVLKSQLPQYDFEVINMGTPAYDSNKIRRTCAEVLRYSPDLVILLMGNNSWDAFYLHNDPWLEKAPFRFLFNRSFLWQTVYLRLKKKEANPYVNKETVTQENYRAILRRYKEAGVPVVIFTVPVNSKDYPPTSPDTPWHLKEYFLARMAAVDGRYKAAISLYEKALRLPGYEKNPHIAFYLAQAYEKTAHDDLAQTYYLAAISNDTETGNRCIPAFNAVVRTYKGTQGVIFIDLERLFESLSPHGLLGFDLFTDQCHWDTNLNPLIIKKIVEGIYRYNASLAESCLAPADAWAYTLDDTPDTLGKLYRDNFKQIFHKDRIIQEVAKKIALFFWGKGDVIESIIYDLQWFHTINPVFFDDIDALKSKIENAISSDIWTAENARGLDRYWGAVLWHIGEAYREIGNPGLALQYFNTSIDEDKDQLYAYLFRGALRYTAKDLDKARADWEKVIELDPRYQWLRGLLQGNG